MFNYSTISDFIPTNIDMGTRCKVFDVKASEYQYWGNKYAESNENYENAAVAIKMKHSMVEKSFWIVLFSGAQCRDTNVQFVSAYWDFPDISDALYQEDCITRDDLGDGVDTILDIVEKFDYLWFTEDEASENEPLVYDDGNAVGTLAYEIIKDQNLQISINKPFEMVTQDDVREIERTLTIARSVLSKDRNIQFYKDIICNRIITSIREDIKSNDMDVLSAMITGEGFKNLDQLSDEEIIEEFNFYVVDTSDNGLKFLEIRADKTIHETERGFAYYNYQGTHFRVFKSFEDAITFTYSKEDLSELVIAEFDYEDELEQFMDDNEICAKCGKVCDFTTDCNPTHDGEPLCAECSVFCESCSKHYIEEDGNYDINDCFVCLNCDDTVKFKFNGIDIKNPAMDETQQNEVNPTLYYKDAYNNYMIEKHTALFDLLLKDTGLTVDIYQTSDWYDDVDETDPYYDSPMFEAHLNNIDGEEIEDTTTGRYCCIASVVEELRGFIEEEVHKA